MEDWDPFADPAPCTELALPPTSTEGRVLATPARNAASPLWDPFGIPGEGKDAGKKVDELSSAARQDMQMALFAHSKAAVAARNHTVGTSSTSSSKVCRSQPTNNSSPLIVENEVRHQANLKTDNSSLSQVAHMSKVNGSTDVAGQSIKERSRATDAGKQTSTVPPASARRGHASASGQEGYRRRYAGNNKYDSSQLDMGVAHNDCQAHYARATEPGSDAELDAAAASGDMGRLFMLMSKRNATESQVGPQHKMQPRFSASSSSMKVVEEDEDEVLDVPEVGEMLSATNHAQDEAIEIPRLEDILAEINHSEDLDTNDAHTGFSVLGGVNNTELEFRPEGSQRALAQIINAQADPNLNAKDLLAPKPNSASRCASKNLARPVFVRKGINVRRPFLTKGDSDFKILNIGESNPL